MHNLTYQERARFAYAAGNDELAEVLEQLAELELDNEVLTDRVWDLEQEITGMREEVKCLEDQVDDLNQQLEAAE